MSATISLRPQRSWLSGRSWLSRRTWHRLVALSIAVLTAVALAVTLAAPADAATKRQRKIGNALEIARNQQGDPYRWGATGPNAFDCSGLVQYSFGRAGLYVPRTSGAQADYSRRIRRGQMRKGDLMFFHSRGNVYHVGFFAGWNGHGRRLMLHAPSSGSRVQIGYVWTQSWYPGTLRR